MGEVTKMVVEVVDAHDLMPKDGQGSSSPFVEVDYDNQMRRTLTKEKNLNPVWNEKLVFDVADRAKLSKQVINVYVYSEEKSLHRRTFLGKVRIPGSNIVDKGEELVQPFPLQSRFFFYFVKGEIRLKTYTCLVDKEPDVSKGGGGGGSNGLEVGTGGGSGSGGGADDAAAAGGGAAGAAAGDGSGVAAASGKAEGGGKTLAVEDKGKEEKETNEEKQEKKEKPVLEMKTESKQHIHKQQTTQQPGKFIVEEKRPEPRPVIMHNVSSQPLDYALKETSPHLGDGRVRSVGGWVSSSERPSTYDLVEQMQHLYVRVVRAKGLPAMDITGSCNPYVEVRLGNYKGTTKHFEKNPNPEWNQVFAFSKDRVQSSFVEVVVKDKEFVKDDFIGRVIFDLNEIPTRVPPDSPLAPQWYKLEERKWDSKIRGELMLAVWMGTQADDAFTEAWHSDAAAMHSDGLVNIRSKVYVSPKLWYVRVNVIEAQDLLPSDKGRFPEFCVKVQLGNQMLKTRTLKIQSTNPLWNEDLVFVAAEPFEEHLVLTVEDHIGQNKDEVMGRTVIPMTAIEKRLDHRPINSRWFNLEKHNIIEGEQRKKEFRFASRIHLRVSLDGGYHVLDESTHYSSDLRPTAKQLWKPPIGILEVGILNANTLLPMKTKDGRGSTDAYCVAKYGQKWVRTRTIIDNFNPKWNEQYTWQVYDPCTVITVGVFDNCHLQGGANDKASGTKDSRIGKVRIRLSTLETDRVYTHSYPLLVLHPSGVKKMGELHLAVRFSCSSLVNMMHMYTVPLLPKMHYLHPFSVGQLESLRYQAMNIVSMRLSRAEPPLRKEVVEYMLDLNSQMWSMRRSKANFFRIMTLLSGVIAVGKWFDQICHWKNPMTTVLVHVLFLILVWYPELILPTVFLYMFLIGIWYFRFRPRHPPHMDTRLSHAEAVFPEELDEEFDTFPTSRSPDLVRSRYDRLRSVAGRIQTVVGDIATQGERFQSLLSWRDPRATTIYIIFCLFAAIVLYVTPFRVVAVLSGLYVLRHPRFRHKIPSVPINFFRRLPARTDRLL